MFLFALVSLRCYSVNRFSPCIALFLLDAPAGAGQVKMKTVKMMSKFMTTTVSTCFMAWKLYHRTLKDAVGVIKAQENKILLERYGLMCTSWCFP